MIGEPMTKAQTARVLGYGDDVAAMDADHDRLHRALCAWLGIHSYSMDLAAGRSLRTEQFAFANYEEDAVLAVQRLMRAHHAKVPA